MTESTSKIRAGIVGGAGYTGGEMLRILINHPNVDIVFVHSSSSAGKHVYDVHTDLFGDTDLQFTSELSNAILMYCSFVLGTAMQRSF
jgi:N-acetyl-gamma-glutamyl-phosphate reductase